MKRFFLRLLELWITFDKMELQEENREEILAFGGKCYLMKVSKDWAAEQEAVVGLDGRSL